MKGRGFSRAKNVRPMEPALAAEETFAGAAAPARILVLGATGFIGKELLRQLIDAAIPTRALVLVRSAAGIPRCVEDASPLLECVTG